MSNFFFLFINIPSGSFERFHTLFKNFLQILEIFNDVIVVQFIQNIFLYYKHFCIFFWDSRTYSKQFGILLLIIEQKLNFSKLFFQINHKKYKKR